jgi:hypothetical protein
MLDFTSKVLTYFKADVSDMRSGLKDLQAEEKKLAQTQLDAANQRNKGYDDWVGKLGKMNQALELGGKVVDFLGDAWKEYAEDVRLAAAAGSANIDRLRKASLGLRTEQELMEFAAKAQNGLIKANQEQMETAEKAMIALTRAGFDQREVTDKVTTAMVSLKTRGLESLGVSVKEGKTDLETFNNLMASLADKARGVDESTLTAGESIQKMGVSMHDSIDDMKSAIGELVQAMAPLLDLLAKAVGLIAKGAKEVLDDVAITPDQLRALINQERKSLGLAALPVESKPAAGRQVVGRYDRWGDDELGGFDEATYASAMRKRGLMGDQGRDKPRDGRFGDVAKMGGTDTAGPPVGFGSTMYADALAAAGLPPALANIDTLQILADKHKALTDDWNTRLAEQQAKKTTFLESTFGKIEDFNAYAQAFQMLSGSVTAAMDAWITGSMSAGQAIKKFLADAIKGLASQMAVEALKHGAYAIGSLAFGDVRGAGQHAAAAAAFAGVAAVAATTAKALGGGGATAGGGANATGGAGAGGGGGSSSSGGSSSGNGKPGKDTYVVVYTDAFAEGSPSYKQEIAQRAVRKAVGGTGWSDD